MTVSATTVEDGKVPGTSRREKLPFMLILFLTLEESIGGVKQRGYARG